MGFALDRDAMRVAINEEFGDWQQRARVGRPRGVHPSGGRRLMRGFSFSAAPFAPDALRTQLADPSCGGYASFEGWVRNHNEGRQVLRLEYEAYEPLALKEGGRIVAEALERFGVRRVACVHRVGELAIGELAVWVGVSAAHRDEAFARVAT